uniref:U6 snRNA-associated Sm-like protein LSm1 n=1 Tax=Spongospora subterranea TaxID=70186 RepID=A0A0H5QLV0_9EUKA|eukprot:CRZ02321.1 hypothetical protein [Spongospora subterranea]
MFFWPRGLLTRACAGFTTQQNMDSVFLEHAVRSSLVDFLERRVQCVLRDGAILIGNLISFDQFYNLVLARAVKRIVVDKQFAEEPVGLYIVRGENVATLSELSVDRDDHVQTLLKRISMKRIRQAQEAKALQAHSRSGRRPTSIADQE